MTLHKAIQQILEERNDGLTYAEIAQSLNENKLYQKKGSSGSLLILESQIKIRIHNYKHLFYVEQGKVFINLKLIQQQRIFHDIISDVIGNTAQYPLRDRQIAIPLLLFCKRVADAGEDYGTIAKHEIFGEFNSSEFFANSSENVDIKQVVISYIDELSQANLEIDSIRTAAIAKLKETNTDLIIDIFLTLDKYSFDSKHFPKNLFGLLFNNLITDLANSITFSERHSSPQDINNIIIKLYGNYGNSVLDPFAGSAGTLVGFQHNYVNHTILGFEKSSEIWLLGKLNLMLNGIYSLSFLNVDSLQVSGLFKQQADLIITDIPFGGRLKKEDYDFETFVNTNDSTNIYLQYLINALKAEGKAVVIIPQAFLFSNTTSAKELKTLMVEEDWLDAIITLPQGIFKPYSDISSAILCIDLNKKNEKSFFFIDATNVELLKNDKGQRFIGDDQADEIVRLFQDRTVEFDSELKINSVSVSGAEIKSQGYDLTSGRHLFSAKHNAQLALFGEEFEDGTIELGEVLFAVIHQISLSKQKSLKWVKSKDMKSSLVNFRLTADEIEETRPENHKNASIVNSNSLLILSNFKTLQPTYFVFEQKKILIPNTISAFKIREDRVLPEYLVSQLYEPYFISQLGTIRKGSTQAYFSIRDFLKLKIKLPDLEKQKLLYDKAKQKFLEQKVSEVDQLTQELIRQKAVAISDQITIISSIQHELGNKLPALKNTIDDLKNFFIYQSKTNNTLSLNAKIRPLFPGENIEEVDSIDDIFKRVDTILNYTISMVDDAGGIINSDPSKFKPQKTVLVDYLKSEIEKFKTVHGNPSNIKFIMPADDGPIMNVDKKQFSIAINNIIQNAIRHGFTEESRYYHIVFQIIPDDYYDILIIKNDGKPFAEGMTIEKYKQPYQYAGNNGHSGLGGYLVYRVVENHKGSLDFVNEIDKTDTFKVQFEIKIPKTIFL